MARVTPGTPNWGHLLNADLDQIEATAGAALPAQGTHTEAPGQPLFRRDLDYVVEAANPNLSEIAVSGTLRSWINEWGALRGRNPYGTWADALVRAIIETGDYVGVGGGAGCAFEISDRTKPEGPARVSWGRRWQTGALVRNGITMADTWIQQTPTTPIPADLPPNTIVRTIGVLEVPDGYWLQGTGAPEGSVTAPVGTRYTNTAATTGAIEWIKATGTGSTGWRLAYGDTGWRNVTTLLHADWVATSAAPMCRIRRVGNQVTFQTRLSPAPAKVGTARVGAHSFINPLPAGFVSDTYLAHGVTMLGSVQAGVTITSSSTNNLQTSMPTTAVTGNWASGDLVHTAVTWTTNDAWPTALPGTSV